MSLLTLERNSPSPQDSDAEETLSSSSHEGFVAREHYVTSLPPRPWASLGRHGGEQLRIFTHLKKVMKLLRNSDTIKLAVDLENSFPRKVTKYLVLVATNGCQDTEEAIVLGTEQEDSTIRLGLVLPLWRDTEIKLDGDGGFSVHSGDRQAVFKPSSVQSMWTTLQTLYQATESARQNNYYVGGLSHTWMTYYLSQLTEDYLIRNEWNLMKDVETFRPDSPIYNAQITAMADSKFEKQLVSKLREVMLHEDLEEVTSRQLRLKLESEVGMDLKDYKEFLDRHMLRILGQMEQPSQILDYLYLGSEWNASNLSELKSLGVGYILNITREIDNFYPEVFKYLNIRLYDVPDSELIKHWGKTYRFIKEAKVVGTKVLVHCKMGISRSAATVVAYMMKEYRMTLVEAKKHVKGIRSCINPNEGFMAQLRDYEGILTARHNPRWGRYAPSRLHRKRSMSDPDLLQSLEKEELEREDEERERKEGDSDSDKEKEEGWSVANQRRFMHSRPIHSVASAYNIPSLVQQQQRELEEPELAFLPEEDDPKPEEEDKRPLASPTTKQTNESDLIVQSTPVDKMHSLRNFLASLPTPLHPLSSNNDDGIGENIPTSNSSGSAYSSPMYTPPNEEHIHMHLLSQQEGTEVTQGIEATRADCCARGTCTGERDEQPPVPCAAKTATAGVPSKPPPPPTAKLPQSQQVAGVTQPPSQSQPIAAPNLAPFRSHRSNSLPQMLCGVSLKKVSVSPTSSHLSISSLTRRSPAVLEEDETREEEKKRDTDPKMKEMAAAEPDELLSEEKEADLLDDETLTEQTSPQSREKFMHHRRTKSDSHDLLGPIKTAQIFSVPERVKEIEEMSQQVPSTQQQTVPLADIHASQLPTNDNSFSVGSLISSSSSEESLAPIHMQSTSEEDKLSNPHLPSQTTELLSRHISLSPRPCSARFPHNQPQPQTTVSLPSSVSPPEYDSSSPPTAFTQGDLANSLQGAVRARVQNIEAKKGEQAVSKSILGLQETVKAEAIVKQTATGKRPMSEIILHTPYVGMVEVSSSDSKAQGPAPDGSELDRAFDLNQERGGGDGGDLSSNSSDRESGEGERVQSEAVYSAWAAILPAEDLHTDDLTSVLKLKMRFEEKKRVRDRSRSPSNLRRSHSLRDSPQLPLPLSHLNRSEPGKQYLSNTSLQLFGHYSSSSQHLNQPSDVNLHSSCKAINPHHL